MEETMNLTLLTNNGCLWYFDDSGNEQMMTNKCFLISILDALYLKTNKYIGILELIDICSIGRDEEINTSTHNDLINNIVDKFNIIIDIYINTCYGLKLVSTTNVDNSYNMKKQRRTTINILSYGKHFELILSSINETIGFERGNNNNCFDYIQRHCLTKYEIKNKNLAEYHRSRNLIGYAIQLFPISISFTENKQLINDSNHRTNDNDSNHQTNDNDSNHRTNEDKLLDLLYQEINIIDDSICANYINQYSNGINSKHIIHNLMNERKEKENIISYFTNL